MSIDDIDDHPGVAAARDAKAITMVAVDRDAPWPDEDTLAAMGPTHPKPVQLADGRWLGTGLSLTPPRRYLALQRGDEHRELPLPWDWEPQSNPRVTPEGDRVLIMMRIGNRGHVVERRIDGEDDWSVVVTAHDPNTPSHLYGLRPNLWGADYAGSADLVVVAWTAGTESHLALHVRGREGWREVHRVSEKGMDPVCRGRFVVVRRAKGAQSYVVVGDGDDARLAKSVKLDGLCYLPHPADTRERLWGHRGGGAAGHVLVGEQLAVARAKPPKR